MIHETTTSLAPEEVLRRAKDFFAARVPATGCFVERESPRHLVLRGQGGEEIVIAVFPAEAGTAVRGSTLLFDQQVGRFFSTLPEAADQPAGAPVGGDGSTGGARSADVAGTASSGAGAP
jgi:hypothetical protein